MSFLNRGEVNARNGDKRALGAVRGERVVLDGKAPPGGAGAGCMGA